MLEERRKKKILIGCSSAINEGKGILTYSKILAESLNQDYEIHFYSKKANDLAWFEANRIKYIHFDVANTSKQNVLELKTYICENKIDYIINNDVIYINILKPAIETPVVNVFHLTRYAILSCALLNEQYINRHIVISNDMLKTVCSKKIDISKVTKILNAINTEDLSYAKKDFTKLRIFCGTENTERKGGKDIIKLIEVLKQSEINFEFVWIGKKTQKVKDSVVGDDRFTIGLRLPREEFLNVMAKSNIYLFPSNEEGCPMSLKEAMTQGLVPIAKNSIGAMNEIVTHGKDGFLLNSSDWLKSTKKIIFKFEELEKKLAIMSVNAHEKIKANFNANRLKSDYIELLNEIDEETNTTTNEKLKKISELTYYDWHRLPYPSTINNFSDFIARLRYKFGILEKSNVK